MTRKYKIGMLVGRFQPFHRGHESIVRKMLEECDKVVIAIGSAQESGTKVNPFRYDYRRFMIQKVFPEHFKRIIIVGIADRTKPADDESWGEYLLNTIYQNTNIKPDVIYQGAENKHSHWFDSFDLHIVNINRELLSVSATEIRKAILEENFDFYKKFMPEALYSEFTNLREILNDVESN
jgi:cytidyltransferase-like protein